MKCPKCGASSWDIIDSRPADDWIRRRRKCRPCKNRITTLEITVPEEIKKFGHAGYLGYLKRKMTIEALNGLIASLEANLDSQP